MLSTTLIVIWTLPGTVTTEVVEVTAIVEVDTVETMVEVAVAVTSPPNGAKRRIVQSGAVGTVGGT
jgi:hypothetical protein